MNILEMFDKLVAEWKLLLSDNIIAFINLVWQQFVREVASRFLIFPLLSFSECWIEKKLLKSVDY